KNNESIEQRNEKTSSENVPNSSALAQEVLGTTKVTYGEHVFDLIMQAGVDLFEIPRSANDR
ncbi:hypothetical protein O5166_26385, partial [Escherichia coli]|nr:hypothetical protein [Escherichia coli]